MYKTVDSEIKKGLIKKGYKYNEISIRSYMGYTNLFGVKLDGKLVEIYDAKGKRFIE